MTRPAIFDAIDTLLIDFDPKGIRACAESSLMPEILAELERIDPPASNLILAIPQFGRHRHAKYREVAIDRSSAQINPAAFPAGAVGEAGWVVLRPAEQFRREERLQPRDPETGQYLPFPEEGA